MNIEVPPPLPDELVFGAISRARSRLGMSTESISRRIFDTVVIVRPHFCGRLDDVAERLRDRAGWKHDAISLRNQHSLAPIALPFIPAYSRLKCEKALHSTEKRIKVLNIPRTVLGITPFSKLRSCLRCQADDLDTFGEAYWHRIHQIPALKICPYHLRPLIEHSVTAEPRIYTTLEESESIAEFEVEKEAFPLQEAIGRNFTDLLNQPIKGFDREQFAETYRISLSRKQLRVGNSWRMAKALESYFGQIALATADSSSPVTVSRLARNFYSHQKKILLPTQFFAIAATHLSDTLRNLIETSRSIPRPEKKPWPCMNPMCSRHGSNIITTKIYKGHQRWSFRCPECRFTYYRDDPLIRNLDGSFDFSMSRKNSSPLKPSNRHTKSIFKRNERRTEWLETCNNPSLRSERDTKKLRRWLASVDNDWFIQNQSERFAFIRRLPHFQKDREKVDSEWLAFSKENLPSEIIELKKHYTYRISYKKLCTVLGACRLKKLPRASSIPMTSTYIRSFTETFDQTRARVNELKKRLKQMHSEAPRQLVLKFSQQNRA